MDKLIKTMEISSQIEDLSFENSQPPKIVQYLLHILAQAKDYTIYYKTKWAKILFLIEVEGRIKFDMSIPMDHHGPYPREAVDYVTSNGFIEEIEKEGMYHQRKEVKLTKKGEQFYNVHCLPFMSEDELSTADKVIKKYINVNLNKILEHVYQNYVYHLNEKKQELPLLEDKIKLIFFNGKPYCNYDTKEGLMQYSMLARLQHILNILKNSEKLEDPVELSVIYNSVSAITNLLKETNYRYDYTFDEEFEFLDHYAETNKIYKSISNEDLSDITESDQKLISKVINQTLQQSFT